jgi:hypothetical protein
MIEGFMSKSLTPCSLLNLSVALSPCESHDYG